ncbi:glycosyl hydrolase family 8 [Bifidobacterium sp. SO1]|uniref:glycosyl hydrolase family 8 n=1 Tax=Bifidobacterium sp. SO1 TaxID=2809029 RepID=UPI001BDC038A|nr:glycosyl hydrolase family 8 [Bifidobacterium sp. SO1]MBT1162031.1 xylanase [Bifidobacterium sp. SO1]
MTTSSPSMFAQCGYAQTDIDARLAQVWHAIFEGPDKVYWDTDDGLGYVMDTGNDDVRTEGMSYAMMLAVQYDRQDVFDKLWGWVMKHMYMADGHHVHYFSWSVKPDGSERAGGPAPDGEEYFAMDLFLAARRWGSRDGIYDYVAQARELLHHCVHKGREEAGDPMWNVDNHLIKFIPETEWTDPSYHLPHFYEVFSQYVGDEDRAFWQTAAKASRAYLERACDETTGLNPEYSLYDGTPHTEAQFGRHDWFYSDAYRTAGNIGLDVSWNGVTDPVLCDRVAALQRFFLTHDRTCAYEVDGTPVADERVLHPVGFIAATAEGSLAAIHADPSRHPDAERNARAWVDLLWNTPLRIGPRRYYDNFLYAFAMLALAGRYRRDW